jgi:hypothetical protein
MALDRRAASPAHFFPSQLISKAGFGIETVQRIIATLQEDKVQHILFVTFRPISHCWKLADLLG